MVPLAGSEGPCLGWSSVAQEVERVQSILLLQKTSILQNEYKLQERIRIVTLLIKQAHDRNEVHVQCK
jgi:hypothetical protein